MTPGTPGYLQSLGLLDWLWQTTWQAAVLIALVAMVCIAGRRVLAPRWRYALWLLVPTMVLASLLPAPSEQLLTRTFNLPTQYGVALVVEVAVGILPMDEYPDADQEPAQQVGHAAPPRMSSTAATYRRHSAVSAPSARRPVPVSA